MGRCLSDSDIDIFIDLCQTELALFVGRVVNKLAYMLARMLQMRQDSALAMRLG
jgi:predicted nucleotidyltransferase